MTHTTFKTDGKFQDKIKQFKALQKVKGYTVGFYQSSTYPNGMTVPEVSAIQEFGSPANRIPERPFFRIANKKAEKTLVNMVKNFISDMKVLTHLDLNMMAEFHAGEIKQSIHDLESPPNAPSTIARKNRTSKDLSKTPKPLVDTGFMLQSVTYKVIK